MRRGFPEVSPLIFPVCLCSLCHSRVSSAFTGPGAEVAAMVSVKTLRPRVEGQTYRKRNDCRMPVSILRSPDGHGIRVCAFAFGCVEAGSEEVFARPHIEASARMRRTGDAPCLVGHDDYAHRVEDADFSGQCIERAERDAIRVVQRSFALRAAAGH